MRLWKGKEVLQFLACLGSLLTAIPGGRSAAIRSTREIYSSTCLR